MDIVKHNREAWNVQARNGGRWSVPVNPEEIAKAQQGSWKVALTPNKSVPSDWFGDIKDKSILCLASGGGQQAPILAAAGGQVTSFDNSDEQLAKDKSVADRDSLQITTIQGDMADLSAFPDKRFDLIFHPTSNVFAEDIGPVWKECFRVLKWNGHLLSGFLNPMYFLFDHENAEKTRTLEVKYPLPYSDLKSLSKEKLETMSQEGLAFAFSHTLEDQIRGQLRAGFVVCDLYEDDWDNDATPLNEFCATYIATLAKKLRRQ